MPVEQIEDWQILQPDGNLKGAHSTIALFRNRQNQGKPLSPKMRKRKALLLDFPGYLTEILNPLDATLQKSREGVQCASTNPT